MPNGGKRKRVFRLKMWLKILSVVLVIAIAATAMLLFTKVEKECCLCSSFRYHAPCLIDLETGKLIHIHGKLSQDWVLGVDNLEQFSNIPFPITENFKHCFIKPYFNQTFDKNRVAQAAKIIHQSDVLCIIGMSLGDSDLTWKNEIINWLSESPEHHLFYYSLEMMEKTKITAFDRVRLESEAKQQLCSKLGINNEDYFEQIHIPISKWLFNIRRMTYTYTTGAHVAQPPIR